MAGPAKVRIYIGTRKGGYIAESDKRRQKWSVRGPFQPGRDVFHIAPDPRHYGEVYAAVNSPFFGPMLFRSKDHGHKWTEIPPPLMPVMSKRPPPTFDSIEPPKRPIVNLWHITPGRSDEPNTVYVGVDPASLYRSDDRGQTWASVLGINEHPTREKWNPGAGGLCMHTILLDERVPHRMYVGISAAGTFRSDDDGDHFRPVNHGVRVSFAPDPLPEFGQCVHKVALDPTNPNTIYRQDHDGIYVSHDAMDSWKRIGKPLASDFGFAVATAPTLPGQAFFVPLKGEARTMPGGSLQVYRWTEKGRQWSPLVRGGAFPGDFGMHREALDTDALDPAGLYLGTTTGQVFYSADTGRAWKQIPYAFPGIHSVAVSSPPSAA